MMANKSMHLITQKLVLDFNMLISCATDYLMVTCIKGLHHLAQFGLYGLRNTGIETFSGKTPLSIKKVSVM